MSTKSGINHQSGAVLLLYALFLAMLAGLGAYGFYAMEKNMDMENPQILLDNRAQAAAYAGVQGILQYDNQQFQTNTGATCANVNAGVTASNALPVILSGTPVSFSATATTLSSTPCLIVVNSTGTESNGTTQTMQAILSQGSSSSSTSAEIPINLNGSTSFSGNVQLEGGQNASIAVNGSISGSQTFSGFNNSYSTGSASYAGTTSGMNLFSNDDITITGSGQYNSIQSLGNVNISGRVDAASIQSNGTTTLGSSSQVSSSITSIGDVTLDAGTSAGSVITQGDVNADNASVGSVQVQGGYTESSDGSVSSGDVGGAISYPSWNSNVHLTQETGLQVPITPLTAVTVSVPQVTASTMSSLANFAFTPPPSGASSDIQGTVVVQNVTGITAGTYYLYDNGGDNDYICPSDATTPSTFDGPSNTCVKIGTGYSSYNADISYSSGTWTLEGNNGSTSDIAPGVLWFQGNVTVSGGTYYNSIIATGNIDYINGRSTSYAVNFANAEGENVCSNTGYTSGTTTINPSNFCTTPYTNATVGDIGILSGGDIDLSSSAVIYGNVIAGDYITTAGGTDTIYGYISAEGMSGTGSNSMGANTVIDINPINGFTPPQITSSYSATSSQQNSPIQLVLSSIRLTIP